ncbi:MAG: hypothetical protein ACI9SE_002461 [Neolewinella sp.]|jgi:hypothetical protein
MPSARQAATGEGSITVLNLAGLASVELFLLTIVIGVRLRPT